MLVEEKLLINNILKEIIMRSNYTIKKAILQYEKEPSTFFLYSVKFSAISIQLGSPFQSWAPSKDSK